jgi:hypothetical protein
VYCKWQDVEQSPGEPHCRGLGFDVSISLHLRSQTASYLQFTTTRAFGSLARSLKAVVWV